HRALPFVATQTASHVRLSSLADVEKRNRLVGDEQSDGPSSQSINLQFSAAAVQPYLSDPCKLDLARSDKSMCRGQPACAMPRIVGRFTTEGDRLSLLRIVQDR